MAVADPESLNILEAIDALPTKGRGKCKIQRWLDELPPDLDGRDQLVAIIETTDPHAPNYRTQSVTIGLLGRLGVETSEKTLGEHRRHECRCYR